MMVNSSHILAALRLRYPATTGEYVVATEVGEGLSASRRRADFVAMSCWPSRGLGIIGVEIKTDKRDWKRELANPAKAEEGCYHFCDRWYIAAPAGFIDPSELPPTWGLLEYDQQKQTLKERVKAPEKEAQQITRRFMASFMRAAGRPSEAEQQELINRAVNERLKSTEERFKRDVETERARNAALVARVQKFDRLAGTSLACADDARLEEIAAFFCAANDLGIVGRRSVLEQASEQVDRIQVAIARAREYAAQPLGAEAVGGVGAKPRE